MKITITLTEAEVKGIKEYLKQVGDIDKPKKEHVKSEVESIIHGYLQAPQNAVADYIGRYVQTV